MTHGNAEWDRFSDKDLIREAEEPDNAQATGRFSEDRESACRELRRRGFSEQDVSMISNGTYRKELHL